MKKKIAASIAAAIMAVTAVAPQAYADKWVKTDSGYTYKYDNGTTAEKGWLKVNGNTYYIQKDGTRKTGWLKTSSGDKYYFGKNGVMYKNKWLTLENGDKYYFRKSGKAAMNGRLTIDGEKYSFDESGKLIVKKVEISLGMSFDDLEKAVNLSEYDTNDIGSMYIKQSDKFTISSNEVFILSGGKVSQYGYAFDNSSGNYSKLKKYYTKTLGEEPDYTNKNGCYWKDKSGYFCLYYSDDYIYALNSKTQLVPKEKAAEKPKSRTVYVTKTGKKYHYDNSCNGGTYYASTLDKAISMGLKPCDKCVH